jgi:hypothetical protein
MSYSGERDNFAPHMALVPMVIEQTSRGERSFDIYPVCSRTRHFSDRPGGRPHG